MELPIVATDILAEPKNLSVTECDNIAAALRDDVVNVAKGVEEVAAGLQEDGVLLLNTVIESGALGQDCVTGECKSNGR